MSAGQDDTRQRARLTRAHLRGVVCARDERYAEAEESCLSAIELDQPIRDPGLRLRLRQAVREDGARAAECNRRRRGHSEGLPRRRASGR